eukprot:TRINITY_DN2664_c0_g1_i1.p1 TRINITY_DN2664_c0_g1~~TRINITY_DN2664_c0_g1_i1.p1  ORF type:complete len:383 (+),score=33.60 TRINITY_DN2664_c0_g1_i1:138-1286(+)
MLAATMSVTVSPLTFHLRESALSSSAAFSCRSTPLQGPPSLSCGRRSDCHCQGGPSTRKTCYDVRSQADPQLSQDAENRAPASKNSDSKLIKLAKKQARASGTSRRQLFGLGMAAFCPCCSSLLGGGSAQAEEWGYGTLSGPGTWGNICKSGSQQSPIDMPLLTKERSAWGELRFLYKPESPSFYNTGHGTMQVDFLSAANRLVFGGRPLQLLQYHFHSPSEHSIGGHRSVMEAHLVHRDAEGKLAVIGVMLEVDPMARRNPCLEAALEFAPNDHYSRKSAPKSCFFRPDPQQRVCPSLEVNPAYLLPEIDDTGRHAYMSYPGSLTTPPCSEGVDWFLLAKSLRVPGEQVIEFMQYVGDQKTLMMNSRPIQPLNNRAVSIGP